MGVLLEQVNVRTCSLRCAMPNSRVQLQTNTTRLDKQYCWHRWLRNQTHPLWCSSVVVCWPHRDDVVVLIEGCQEGATSALLDIPNYCSCNGLGNCSDPRYWYDIEISSNRALNGMVGTNTLRYRLARRWVVQGTLECRTITRPERYISSES